MKDSVRGPLALRQEAVAPGGGASGPARLPVRKAPANSVLPTRLPPGPLPDPVALADTSGRIVGTNEAWQRCCSYAGFVNSEGSSIENEDLLRGIREVLDPRSCTREVALEIDDSTPGQTLVVRIARDSSDPATARLSIDGHDSGAVADGLLESLVCGSDYAVLAADEQRRVTFVNDYCSRMLGYSCDEFATNGQNPFEFDGIDEGQRDALKAAMTRGESVRCRQALPDSQGTELHLDMIIQPLRDTAQAVTGWIAIGHDVSEQMRLRDQFDAHETRLKLTLESARMGTWEVDRETGDVIVDDSWLQLAGILPSERHRAGEIWRDRIHPDDRDVMLDRIEGALDGSTDVQTSQYRVVRPDGSVIWIQDTSRVTARDAEGVATRLVGVVADITALKDAITNAERAADRLWMATEAAGLGVWDHDLLEKKFFWSRRMCEIHGLDEATESIEAYAARTHPDDRARVEETILQGRKSGKPFQIQYRICRPDGEIRHIEILAEVYKKDDGTPYRAVGITRDVTEQIQQALERQQAQKLESVGRLAAGIAHEINTPSQYVSENIRFVSSALDVVAPLVQCLENPADRSQLEEAWSTITNGERAAYLMNEAPQAVKEALAGMERIADIVRSMRTFSHPGNSRVPVDINEAIGSAMTISRSEWSDQAEVRTDFDSQLPCVPVVPGEFNQVMLNLVINAAHAIEERRAAEPELAGRIHIATRRCGDTVDVTVADNGIGMTSEVQEKIFDPFFTTKPVGKGTGQGLALTHTFIQSHAGAIDVESRVGSGTRITLKMPLNGEAPVGGHSS